MNKLALGPKNQPENARNYIPVTPKAGKSSQRPKKSRPKGERSQTCSAAPGPRANTREKKKSMRGVYEDEPA